MRQVASVDIKLPRRRSLQVEFSCNSCGERRTKRLINRLAYERGLVFVQVQTGRSSPYRTRLAAPVAIQNMGDVGQDQAAINAQLLAANEELRASLRAITAELTQLRQGGRPNGPRPPGRNQPDPHDTDLDADSTDDTRSQDEDMPNQGGRRNAQGCRVQVGGGRDYRGGRDREDEEPWLGGKALKLNPPTFAGKVDPDAYIVWETHGIHLRLLPV
uniref:Uncharacterized protein n=1 Tax=Brassica oleracea TaxID=3712 RepID=A0A3P6DRN8_BRAOL|nr:unnamed protein product [Brassica oleracea]